MNYVKVAITPELLVQEQLELKALLLVKMDLTSIHQVAFVHKIRTILDLVARLFVVMELKQLMRVVMMGILTVEMVVQCFVKKKSDIPAPKMQTCSLLV
jgi:hypothetical protein